MAKLSTNWAGAVLELDNDETNTLLETDDVSSALIGLVGGAVAVAGLGPLGAGLGLIAAYLQANKALVQAVNRGNGVYLTLPWPAIWWGQWWVIVPTTR